MAGMVGWAGALGDVLGRLRSHHSTLAAAGCAFYATLSLFPAMTLLLSLYGLAFNPYTVAPQLDVLRDFVPPETHALILREVHTLVAHRHGTLGLGAALGALVTLWSATNGTRAMLTAMTLAYDGQQRSRGWRRELTGLAMTLVAVVAAALALALLVALPALLEYLGLPRRERLPVHVLSLAVLAGFVALSFAAVYWFGPPHRRGERRVVWPGTVAATLLWLAASSVFSLYVVGLAGVDTNYGPLGAAAGLLLWFYVAAWVTLFGAELNATLERRRAARVSGSTP
jgi:membrane protein